MRHRNVREGCTRHAFIGINSNMFRAAVITSTAVLYEKVGVFVRRRICIVYSTNYYYYYNNTSSSSSLNTIPLCCDVRFPVISSVGSRYNSSLTYIRTMIT